MKSGVKPMDFRQIIINQKRQQLKLNRSEIKTDCIFIIAFI